MYLRLLRYLKPYLPRLGAAVFCTAIAAAGNLYVPWIIKDVIDKVLSNRDAYMLNMIAAGIVVIFLVRGVAFYGQN